ncbi:MAG: hypothetical protein J6M06_03220 [Synergistaceae bacterium]|nr:hypothetical protein [Synergistaceae bacterium]
MIYAGTGSRQTPVDVCDHMEYCAAWFARHGFVLRSSRKEGAETAFEHGCDDVGGAKEIFLPWAGFNNSSLFYSNNPERLPDIAFATAAKFHPAWESLPPSVKILVACETCQVLGTDCKSPADFVLCWTPDGGGIEQVLRIAQSYAVPVFNMAEPGWKGALRRLLGMPC